MKVNQLKAGAALSYVSMGLQYVIALVYTPIMLRLLGQSEYGLYNLVASVVAYLGLLNFGFGSAYLRYYSKYKAKEDKENIAKLNGMFLIIFSVIGIVAVLAGMVLTFYTDVIFGAKLTEIELSKAKILMVIMVINIAISFPNIVFSTYITANENFIFQKLLEITRTIINPFLILPVLLLGYGSIGMAVVVTLLTIAIQIANATFSFKRLGMRFSFKGFKFSLMKEMTVFSSFVFLYMIMDQVLWNVDKLILGILWGTTTVAIYSIAALFNTYYISFSTAISSVFVPRVNNIVFSMEKEKSNKSLTELMIRVGRIQLLVIVLIMLGIIFFGQPFIVMWAGVNYREAYYIAMILIIPVTLPLTQNLGIAIQRAKNMQQFLAIVNALIAVLNVAISIPLAKMYGGVGSAIGTSIAMIIGNILITNWYYHYKIGLNMKKFWIEIAKIFPAMIFPIIFGTILFLSVDLYNIKKFIIYGFMFVIVYVFSVWKFAMNEYEKDLISKPLKRIHLSMCRKG